MMVRGIAGGTKFGVAKEANILAVKVLSDKGYVHSQELLEFFNNELRTNYYFPPIVCSSGATSDMYVCQIHISICIRRHPDFNCTSSIAGLNFILNQYLANGRRPTVINMSLGGPANTALDKAIQKVGRVPVLSGGAQFDSFNHDCMHCT